MNIISLLLGLAAIILFASGTEARKYNTLHLGLACLSAAWVIQLLWADGKQITF